MTPSQIITAGLTQLGEDPQKGLQAAAMLLNSGKGVMLQANNSILILDRLKAHEVLAHLFTMDEPLNFINSANELAKKIEHGEIKKLYAGTNSKKIIEMFEHTKHAFSVQNASVLPKPKKEIKNKVTKVKLEKGSK